MNYRATTGQVSTSRSGPCGPPKPLKAVLDLDATSDGWFAENMLIMITIITIIAMIKIILLP